MFPTDFLDDRTINGKFKHKKIERKQKHQQTYSSEIDLNYHFGGHSSTHTH